MKNYIVRNCPAYNINTNHCRNEIIADCKNITDCSMKQIVATCKQEISTSSKDAPTNAYAMGRVVVAEKILEQLEIEEVNE